MFAYDHQAQSTHIWAYTQVTYLGSTGSKSVSSIVPHYNVVVVTLAGSGRLSIAMAWLWFSFASVTCLSVSSVYTPSKKSSLTYRHIA